VPLLLVGLDSFPELEPESVREPEPESLLEPELESLFEPELESLLEPELESLVEPESLLELELPSLLCESDAGELGAALAALDEERESVMYQPLPLNTMPTG
jgi:hypothetical protein